MAPDGIWVRSPSRVWRTPNTATPAIWQQRAQPTENSPLGFVVYLVDYPGKGILLTQGDSMHLIALLILPALACAEPAGTQSEKPDLGLKLATDVELKLSAGSLNSLEITIENHGQEPLVLPYRVSPLEHFVVELRGEQGKQYKIEHTGQNPNKAEPGTLTVPAGKSKIVSVHTCHYLHTLGDGDQKVTFLARLKHDGKTIESKPLTVEP
jgi:hypothetical protein